MRLAGQRRQTILARLRAGALDVEALSAELGVSASTIRRDLARLAAGGQVLRTYGGAAVPEQSLQVRAGVNMEQKRAIARLAASFVQQGETLLLDAGTTTGALAAELAGMQGLHVITNGLTALNALAGKPGVELSVLGGQLRQISLGTVGPAAEHALRRLTARRTFLGADGVVAGRGICEATDAQSALKELMVAQGQEVYVLADADKLGRAISPSWTPLPASWTLITDARASAAQLAPFRALPGVTVLIA
ncbi:MULTISPECIES: DeoR/GlpR family DNA-binding transcription regulator [Acidocella]|uniref:DeoR/GlpR family DNA-binding transcription regulator n=1 Tax=Acidocella TaxID=50709 RepID=UPI00028D49B7|nr:MULTISPECIES: DeoR/GlpR family DNA-binding transcription regulator [Acidocella]EKM98333.1 DeoR family transcriptional regulator [Acidocella sp. MX-AZ02]